MPRRNPTSSTKSSKTSPKQPTPPKSWWAELPPEEHALHTPDVRKYLRDHPPMAPNGLRMREAQLTLSLDDMDKVGACHASYGAMRTWLAELGYQPDEELQLTWSPLAHLWLLTSDVHSSYIDFLRHHGLLPTWSLEGWDLSGLTFDGNGGYKAFVELNLQGTLWKDVELTSVTMRDVDLTRAQFSHARLSHGTWIKVCAPMCIDHSTLRHTLWSRCDVAHTAMVGTTLHGCAIQQSDMDSSSLVDCTLKGVTFKEVKWGMASVKGTLFESCTWSEGCTLNDTIFTACVMRSCTLRGVNFSDADLRGCVFENCTLRNCAFQGAQWDPQRPPPDGYVFNNDTGRLFRAPEAPLQEPEGESMARKTTKPPVSRWAKLPRERKALSTPWVRQYLKENPAMDEVTRLPFPEMTIKLDREVLLRIGACSEALRELDQWIEQVGRRWVLTLKWSPLAQLWAARCLPGGHLDILYGRRLLPRWSLQGYNLRGVDLHSAHLNDMCFDGCTLSQSDLTSASLESASLHGATMNNALLCEAVGRRADIRWANLRKADLTASNWQSCDFSFANLAFARAREAFFLDTDLSHACLVGADLTSSMLRGCNMVVLNGPDANFTSARLEDCNLEKAKLAGANFTRTVLTRVNFRGADLRGVVFKGAIATDVDFTDAEWSRHVPAPRGCRVVKGKLKHRFDR